MPVAPDFSQVNRPALCQDDLLWLVVIKNGKRPQDPDRIPKLPDDIDEELEQRDKNGGSEHFPAEAARRGQPKRIAAHRKDQGSHVPEPRAERRRVQTECIRVDVYRKGETLQVLAA